MAEEGPVPSLPSLVAPSVAALFFFLPLPLPFLPPACVEFGVVVRLRGWLRRGVWGPFDTVNEGAHTPHTTPTYTHTTHTHRRRGDEGGGLRGGDGGLGLLLRQRGQRGLCMIGFGGWVDGLVD